MSGNVLGTAVSGLMVAQRSLEVTSNNIANANTEGYSRQSVTQASLSSQLSDGGYVGKGVQITDITRSYDSFLTQQLRSSASAYGDVSQYQQLAGQIDTFVADPASGMAPAMKTLFGDMNKVANDPSSIAARQTVVMDADSLVQRYNSMNSRFQDLNSQVSQNMVTTVDQINTYTKGIADINVKVSKYINGVDGSHQPNDLLDQRDLLINKLSALVDVNVVAQGNGMQNVYIGKGQPLVIDGKTNTVNLAAQPSDPTKLDVFLQTTGSSQNISAQIVGGSLSGAMRFRDEMLAPTKQSLKNIAETLTSQINQVHKVGFDLNGGTGNDFFTFNATTGELKNNITDPRTLAAATTAAGLPGDNRNALAMANLENTPVAILQNGVTTGTTATLQDAYGQMVSKVGALANAANVSASAQQSLLNNAKTASESVSGVNLDEEAANLIKYQQSYQAAAQLISITKTVFDSLLSAFR